MIYWNFNISNSLSKCTECYLEDNRKLNPLTGKCEC